ncbi:MAG: chloride channel protein [candidate division Zixibacteria bacterium]|nr:chloride channel protein [candidate division Zixibacteria bacterium]MDH3937419.1 chloride channel protein [candidate division Zixibacteria bacterium]
MFSGLLDKYYHRFEFHGTHVLILLAVFVGLATAFGAMGFTWLIRYFNDLAFGLTDQILTEAVGARGFKFWLPLIPMVGGLLVGPIVYLFAREAKGHGVPEVMNAVARLGGIIRARVAVAKTIASAICIGSGGSAGREGPIVQIGSAIGSTVGQMFRMSGDRVRILVGCGAAAGISAVFNAPIAGVIFSLEVILGDFAIKTFSPVILSSVVASVVTRSFMGDHPAFTVPSYSLVSAWEIPLYVVMGAAMGGGGVIFTRTLTWFEDMFEKLKITDWTKPAVGGLMLGCIAIFYPQVLADGYETISLTLHGQLGVSLLLLLIVLKLLATSFTLGSGNSGGIFAPSLFMGAVGGGAFGFLVNYLFPGTVATPGAYALVGMAGMVAAATHAPITAMLIIFEMTSDYRIILPLMVTVVFAALIAGKLFEHSVYTIKLARRGIDIRGGKDINVLRSHKVSEIMDSKFETLSAATPLLSIFHAIERSSDSYFIVLDSAEQLRGVLSFQDIRSLMSEHTLDHLVIAQDVVNPETAVLLADDTLETAYRMFNLRDLRLIPIVVAGDEKKVIGVLRRDELLGYYNKQLIETLRR